MFLGLPGGRRDGSDGGTSASPLRQTSLILFGFVTTVGVLMAGGCVETVPPVPDLRGISIAGPQMVPEGGIGNFAATAMFVDGSTQDVTATAVWSITLGPGTIDASGVYTAPATVSGETPVRVQASYAGMGVTESASMDFNVVTTMGEAKNLEIAGPDTVAEGGTASFISTASTDEGLSRDVTGNTRWEILSGPGEISPSGLYRAPSTVSADTPVTIGATYSEGDQAYTAKALSLESQKSLTIVRGQKARPTGLAVTGTTVLGEGATESYQATVTYEGGGSADVTLNVVWSISSGPGTITTAGAYTAPEVSGETPVTIRASYQERNATVDASLDLIVMDDAAPAPASLTITGPEAVKAGGSSAYRVTATFTDGATADVTEKASWTVASGPGAVDEGGVYTAPAALDGATAAMLQVSYAQNGVSLTAEKSITLTNGTAGLDHVMIGGATTVNEAGEARYIATAHYADGTTADVTGQAVWTLVAGPGSMGADGRYTAPDVVTADTAVTIQAGYSEGGIGKQGTLRITVANTIRILEGLTLDGPVEIDEGGTGEFSLKATYDDGGTSDVASKANWSVVEGSGAFIRPGVYSALASLTADQAVKVQAAYAENNVTKQAAKSFAVRNTRKELVAVQIAGPDTVAAGASANYQAVATYDDQTTTDVTGAAEWSVTSGPGQISAGVYQTPTDVASDVSVIIAAEYVEDAASVQGDKKVAVKAASALLSEDFESYADGASPTNWLDTDVQSSLTRSDGIFAVHDVGGTMAFGTPGVFSDAHAHYVAGGSESWSNYEVTGRMMTTTTDGSLGVTFYSDYPNSDTYYRLRRFAGTSFHVSPHPNGDQMSGGVTDTQVTPQPNVWYRYRVQVISLANQTVVKAKVWADGENEPTAWQADCYDSRSARRTAGKVGLWCGLHEGKYWDDFQVRSLGDAGENNPPTANAGPDQTVSDSGGNGSEQVTLDGSGSNDPDGDIVSYVWREGTNQIATGPNPTVTLTNGAHTITLTVTDDGGLTASDSVSVTVSATTNQLPTANAGPDRTVTDTDDNGSQQVTLDGSGSSDSDGSIAGYVWRKGTTQIATGARPSVTLSVGTHTITLEVTDDRGGKDLDTVVITVVPPQSAGSWTPPIGIPAPSFGIEQSHTMYANATFDFGSGPQPYRNAGNGPYTHYVDCTHSAATDTSNPYGSPTKPRRTIPLNLAPGSVVEIHGGPYTYTNFLGSRLGLTGRGTASKPIFVRGFSAANLPVFTGETVIKASYLILENVKFDAVGGRLGNMSIRAPSDHVAVRHCENTNFAPTSWCGVWATAVGSEATPYVDTNDDIVFYDNKIYYNGNWRDDHENGIQSIIIQSGTNRVWVVDNELHHNGEDGVQVYHGGGRANPASHVYIGRNVIHHNGENAIDIKQASDVIISQNEVYGFYPTDYPDSGSDGAAIVVHYDPTHIWMLYNHVYDCTIGIRVNGAIDAHLIGNVMHDIHHYANDAYDPYSAWSAGSAVISWATPLLELVGNTIYNCDAGLLYPGGGQLKVRMANNIIANIAEPAYHIGIVVSDVANLSEMHHNLIWQSGSLGTRIRWGGTTYSLAAFKAAFANQGEGCIEADPKFVNAGADDYHLQSTSPAVDKGCTVNVYTTFRNLYGLDIQVDCEGRSRPAGAACDMGAYECR